MAMWANAADDTLGIKRIAMQLEWMQQSGEQLPSPSKQIEFSVDDDSGEELCTWVEVESASAVTP